MNFTPDPKSNSDPLPNAGGPPTELPPVETPSAGFIVQLFVIPAVIVAVVILVWLLFGKLAGGERDVMWYVQSLKSADANFRSAYELGSLIRNDPKIAGDSVVLGELTALLDRDLDEKAEPRLLEYLAASLGVFTTLDAKTESGQAVDPLAVLRKALGESYPEPVRRAAAVSIASHAARLKGKLEDPKVIEALEATKSSDSADVRKLAVFALGFCGGDAATKALRERLNDGDRDVRYNAAAALARRGDLAAKGYLKEMLSPVDLEKALSAVPESERRNQVEAIEMTAIESIFKGIQAGKFDLAESVRPELEAQTRSGLVSVRTLATEVLKSLPTKPTP